MAVGDESRTSFQQKLRYFASQQESAAQPLDLRRNRSYLEQILDDRRRNIALTATFNNAAASLHSRAACSVVSVPKSTASRKQVSKAQKQQTPATNHVAPAVKREGRKSVGSTTPQAERRERDGALEVSVSYAEECIFAAYFLLSRGLYDDALDVCLRSIEGDVKTTLQDICSITDAVSALGKGAKKTTSFNRLLRTEGESPTTGRRGLRFVAKEFDQEKRGKFTDVWRVVVQYDFLAQACQFFRLLRGESMPDCQSGLPQQAIGCLEHIVERLVSACDVDADLNYFVLFNATVIVYEMCLHLVRYAYDSTADVMPVIMRSIAYCIEVCESGTLKLLTTRYLPWRVRLHEFLCNCYERQGLYEEALHHAQRTLVKVREIVELEFVDGVGPSDETKEVLLVILYDVHLTVLRYTWYVNGSAVEKFSSPQSPSLGTGEGTHGTKQGPSGADSAAREGSEPLVGDLPCGGLDILDKAWQTVLRVELPTASEVSAALVGGAGYRINKSKQQQKSRDRRNMDSWKKLKLAERARAPLLRFMLALAITSPPRTSCPESRRALCVEAAPEPSKFTDKLRQWAVSALEFIARNAVRHYVKENPEVAEECRGAGFEDYGATPNVSQVHPSDLSANRVPGRKAVVSRRKGREGNAAPQEFAVEDDVLLKSITLEYLLFDVGFPKPPVYLVDSGNEDQRVGRLLPYLTEAGEEGLATALLLFCVLFSGSDVSLYGQLCFCSVRLLWRKLGEFGEGLASRPASPLPVSCKQPGRHSRTPGWTLAGVFTSSLHILRHMRHVSEGAETRSSTNGRSLEDIYRVLPITQHLRLLLEQCKGPSMVSIANGTDRDNGLFASPWQANDSLAPSISSPTLSPALYPPLLGSSFAVSESVRAICQQLLEQGAEFLLRRMSCYSPSNLPVVRLSVPSVREGGDAAAEAERQLDKDLVELYHDIICTYLDVKVNSGLTSATDFGDLVLRYAKEVVAEVKKASCNQGDGEDDGARAAPGVTVLATALPTPRQGEETCGLKDGPAGGVDFAYLLRKKHHHATLGISAINIALKWLSNITKRPNMCFSMHSVGACHSAKLGLDSQLSVLSVRREREVCDMRTDLMRYRIELCWYASLYEQSFTVIEKRRADIKKIKERHAKAEIYGAVTLKEKNILKSLVEEEPRFLDTNERERRRLVAWARETSDPLLLALVLLCLASHQPRRKTQREMLEQAFHLLCRPEWCVLDGCDRTEGATSRGCSDYSPLMIWCYAATICGKLGFTEWTEKSKDVIHRAFMCGGSISPSANNATISQSVGTIAREVATTTSEASSPPPSPVAEANTALNPLEFQPNGEVLATSSPLQLRALVSAVLWMSVGDMRSHGYENFCTTGLMPFTDQSILVNVPFQQRYKLSETQFVYMRCACRIRFVMELAFRVKDYGNVMRCAFELFNALLPTLVDDNFCPLVLRPLGTLCKVLLSHPASMSDDPNGQLLAARVVGALLVTIRRMSSVHSSAACTVLYSEVGNKEQATGQRTGVAAPVSLGEVDPEDLFVLPSTIIGWYELLLQTFERAWNDTYNNPTPRQLRHRHYIRCNGRRVRRVVSAEGSVPEGPQGGISPGNQRDIASRGASSRLHHGSRLTSAAPTQQVTDGAAEGCSFPGSTYVVLSDIIDDCVPVEYVELLGEVLFRVPASVTGSLRRVFSSRDRPLDSTLTPSTNYVVLDGVPPWLLDIARAVHNKSPQTAIDRLHQVGDHPMYARTVCHVVENFIEQGDVLNARRLALDALKRLKDLHALAKEHQNGLLENMREWLRREGYFPAQWKSVSSVGASTADKSRMQAGPRESAAGDTKTPPSPNNRPKQQGLGSDSEEGWSIDQKQMLRQLTRGFAWVWRRRATQWVRSRMMQFCIPFAAKLHFFLVKLSLLHLEQCLLLQEKGIIDSHGKFVRRGSKTKGGGEELLSGPSEDVSKNKRGAQGQAADEGDDEERFLLHAVRSARLFNRCRLPAQAFKAVVLAVDGIRTFVCDDPTDIQPPADAQQALLEDMCGRATPSCVGTQSSDTIDSFIDPRLHRFVGTLSVADQRPSVTQVEPRACEKLVALGPRIFPLAQVLGRTLLLLWEGHVDYRRDLEIVQPNAVKISRDVLLGEQLPFQGRIPSLFSLASAAGQYEEAHLQYVRSVDQRRMSHSVFYRSQEVATRESAERAGMQRDLLQELHSMVEMWVDKVPDAVYFLMELEGNCEILELELVERKSAHDVAVAQRQQWEESISPKRKKNGRGQRTTRYVPTPISFEDPDGVELAAKRLGYTVPVEVAISKLMFLLRCTQFSCQLKALQIAEEVQKLTNGSFSRYLLPFVMSVQRTIGEPVAKETIDKLFDVYRGESRQKALSRNARWTWRKYTKTEAYSRVVQRLGRTLLPSWNFQAEPKISVLSMPNASFNFSAGESSLVSEGGGETYRPQAASHKNDDAVRSGKALSTNGPNSTSRTLSLHDVVASFDSLTSYLRQRRLFGLLAEELYELGRIYILHRQRDEAERCWLDSVDAALGVPESLRNLNAVDPWSQFTAATVGFPRILLAILSLTALAMYAYREQQKRAVDACLLCVRILERLFNQSASSGLPQCPRDFCGFALEDIVILPHLREPLTALMSQIVHHLLFLGWELLQFKFPVYAAMVASLAEYLARTYVRHVSLTVEIRLLKAKAAAYSGSYGASMAVLRDVCQGRRLPSVALENLDLCSSGGDAMKTLKGFKGVESTVQARRQAEPPGETAGGQSSQQQQQSHEEAFLFGLYNDNELPTSPGNVACIQAFITQCFGTSGSDERPVGDTSATPVAQTVSSLMSGTSALPESVSAHYGMRLSLRVELAVAECLVALGSKEAAYVWGAFGAQAQAATSSTMTGGDRRVMRSRGNQRLAVVTCSNSACREALNAAEQILQVILVRQHKRQQQRQGERQQHTRQGGNSGSAVGDGNPFTFRGRRGFARDGAISSGRSLDGANTKRWREVEDMYTRCTCERLLSKIYTVRGESMRALGLLKGLIGSFESGGSFVCNIPHVPSFLWTVGTHSFWCDIYELMTQNHMRLLEYTAARKVVDHALSLCDQCGDSYSARTFSLYRSAISVHIGSAADAKETLNGLLNTSQLLGCDSRVDLIHPWIVMALETLQREDQNNEIPKGSVSSVELLEDAVLDFQDYSQLHSLLPLVFSFNRGGKPGRRRLMERSSTGGRVAWRQFACLPWSTDAVFLHRAVNALAEEHIRLGSLGQAEQLLQLVILSVASRYDTVAHPTALIESHFMLARLLCLRDPSLTMSKQRESPGQRQPKEREAVCAATAAPVGHEMLSEEEMIASLEPQRQNPVRLLLSVVKQMVTVGIHDYSILRRALLLLSALFAQAGRPFGAAAANCAVLAKLVADMRFHVFNGTSVYSLYGDDAISLGTDVVFTENVTAHIHYLQRNVGNVMEQEGSGWDGTNTGGTPSHPSTSSHPRTRDERERLAQKNNVSLPAVVSAFAALHRERSLDYMSPPQESLDLEVALQHVRAFLQTRTVPLSCGYLWYSEGTLESFLRQQVFAATRLGAGLRPQRGVGPSAAIAADDSPPPTAFLPPVVMDTLPSLLSYQTLQQLHVPRANTVICNTFVSEAGVGDRTTYDGCGSASGTRVPKEQKATEGFGGCKRSGVTTTLKFVLVVSPNNDPAQTQPPSFSEKPHHVSKRALRGGNRSMAHSMAASTADGVRAGDAGPAQHLWNNTQCVVFDCSFSDVKELQTQAAHTLLLMQTLEPPSPPKKSPPVVESRANEEDGSVSASLTQQLNEVLSVLMMKLAPASTGRKVVRAPVMVENLLSGTANVNSLAAGIGGGVVGAGVNHGSSWSARGGTAAGNHADKAVPGATPSCKGRVEGEECDGSGEVSPVDEAKSKLITSFIQMIVASVFPRAVVDEVLMEHSVDTLMPRCAVTADIVRFLMAVMDVDGHGASLFNPGLHEWFSRIAVFGSGRTPI